MKVSLSGVLKRSIGVEKLVALLLLFILLTAAVAGVSAALTGPDWSSLWISLLVGMLVGWVLAIFHWPAWRSALLLVVLGVLFSFLFSGGLAGKILAVLGEFFRLFGQVVSLIKSGRVDLNPFIGSLSQLFSSTGVIIGRVDGWLTGLAAGQPAFDPVAANIVWSAMVWMVAAWAGWMVEATRNALAAVAPALALNLGTLSYGRQNPATIYLILGLTLILIAVVQYSRHEQEWSMKQVAYPRRKGRELGSLAVGIAILLVVLAALTSSLSLQQIIHWSSGIRGSSPQSGGGLAKSLGIAPGPTPTHNAFTNISNPGLPRQILIGAGPELSSDVVMSVLVSNLPTLSNGVRLPPLYWRSFTYDIYNGHGWSTSATTVSQYKVGQAIQPGQLPDHGLITQEINAVPGQGGPIYAAGEPVMANVATSAAWRSSDDLFGIQAGSNTYQIQSLLPLVDETNLRNAGQTYPAWVTQRYLALPGEVPSRVRDLAIQLTAAEPTPYDRAHAIEQYLRQTYPYTLDVPRPPANRDLVDYFLFDLRKGYCDYYASAMVILARAAGIPARLVVGYATGTYNEKTAHYIVTQANAHSWVEVYFPGIGWVPFEPTAGLPAINRSSQPTPATTPTPAPPPVISNRGGISFGSAGKVIVAIILAIVAGLGITWIALDEISLHRLSPQPAAREVYRRIRRYGTLLRVPTQGGETPYEFGILLARRISQITGEGISSKKSLADLGETQILLEEIVRLIYRPVRYDTGQAVDITRQWGRLRWRMRQLWLVDRWILVRSSVKNILNFRSGGLPTQAD